MRDIYIDDAGKARFVGNETVSQMTGLLPGAWYQLDPELIQLTGGTVEEFLAHPKVSDEETVTALNMENILVAYTGSFSCEQNVKINDRYDIRPLHKKKSIKVYAPQRAPDAVKDEGIELVGLGEEAEWSVYRVEADTPMINVTKYLGDSRTILVSSSSAIRVLLGKLQPNPVFSSWKWTINYIKGLVDDE